jgi:alanyl-tRNA synthetase
VKPGIQIKESDRDRSRRILKFKVRREDILKGGPDTIFGHTCVCVVVRRVELLKEDFEIALGEDEQVFMTEALAIAGDTPDKIPKLAEERKVETDAAVSKVEETAEKEREAREAENARSKEIQRETDAKAESTASAVKKTARKTAATRKAVKTAVKKSKMALGKSGATAVKKAAASKKKAAAKDATAIKKKVKAATKGAKKVTKAPAKKTPVKKSGAKKPARFGRYDDMSTEDLRTAAKVMGVKGTVKMDRVALLKALKKLA